MSEETNNNATTEKKKPAHKISLGNVQVAVWLNKSSEGKNYYSVTSRRRYKNGEGWKDSDSFRMSDLPVLSRSIDLAFEYLTNQTNTDN